MTAHQIATSQSVVRDYVALAKPRIIVLLLFSALTGMFLAAEGTPEASLVLLVLGAGTLASAGANALNHTIDRDIDRVMTRTRNRPVATGRIGARPALVFGTVLNALAFGLLTAYVNPLSAFLTLSATLFYVFVYTKALKRTTPQNIVIGGAAGAIPPMVGWTAVTGQIELPALYLFAIVFFWTPPHFWALALTLKDDYARAGIPMLPVVAGIEETKKAIFLYTLLVFGLTMMFFVTRTVGWIYMSASATLGLVFIFYAWRLMRGAGIGHARGVFLYSMVYLVLLFGAVIVDSLVSF